jgi:hypothetical protein
MDHLDIPKDCGTHQICDDCNVSKEDFEFVMRVDMHRLRLRSYGGCRFVHFFFVLDFLSFINALHLITFSI